MPLRSAAGIRRISFGAALLVATASLAGAQAEPRHPAHRVVAARNGAARLIVHVEGAGPAIVMLPALGRGVADFDDLSGSLVAAGYTSVRADPRGIAGSVGPMENLSLDILAEDARAALAAAGFERAVFIGHAFGGRIARRLAEIHPECVRGIVLLATGGKVPMAGGIAESLWQSYDLTLPIERRMAAVRRAFFAPASDPWAWKDGWWPSVTQAQLQASGRPSLEAWWRGGGKKMLVLQGMNDVLGPPENAVRLKADLGDQVRIVEVPNAGHAMLPEQPRIVATEVLKFIGEIDAAQPSLPRAD